MKVKKYITQSIAMLMCVVVLSLSLGDNFCFYNNIAKTHAADPFTLTMGSLALEEIILDIAIAVLGAEVVYQYRDEIVDSYKEFSQNGSTLYTRNNLMEVYYNGEYYALTWDDYAEMLKGMGSTSSEKIEDYKENFSDVFVRPCKEFIQYISDFYTRLFTDTPQAGDEGYIEGLSEYLDKGSIFENYEMVDGVYNWYFNAYAIDNPSYVMCLNKPSSTTTSRDFIVLNNNCLKRYSWIDSAGKSYNHNFGMMCYINGAYEYDRSFNTIDLAQYSVTTCNMPIFDSVEVAEDAMLLFDYSSALNYGKSMDAIAIPGDDIPTVGNWDDLWERLKNPDLPWWFCNPDALGLANTSDLPWFDVEGLHDWAQDIPSIRDGIIASNPDIPWIDVWDKVIDIPDVIIPGVDFPYPGVIDPSIPKVDDPSADIPNDLTEELDTVVDYVPTLADSLTDMGDGLKKKFPFSIPWDIHYILSGLATTPKAPRFELPLKVERYGIDETIVVDMARFQVLSDLSRSIFSLLFAMVLINLTIKVIGSLKEE